MKEENLFVLTLDLKIKNNWENVLTKSFPDTGFVIKQGFPLGSNKFSGLLEIRNGDVDKILKFLKRKFSNYSFERFYDNSNLIYFLIQDKIVSKILNDSKSVLSWPIPLLKENKRYRFIVKSSNIEDVIYPIEKNKIEITKFSKVNVDFTLKEILTPKQKDILVPSLKHGYYSFPKKISLNDLSKKIGISPSTLCVHLQKIESKIINSEYQDFLFSF